MHQQQQQDQQQLQQQNKHQGSYYNSNDNNFGSNIDIEHRNVIVHSTSYFHRCRSIRKFCYCACLKNNCFCRTSNVRALWTMFFLNTIFAVSQIVAGWAANSLSMMGDSGSMLVDSLSYLVNIYAESRKLTEGRAAAKLEGYAALVSVALLLGVTISVLLDASKRLCCPVDDEEDVDGEVVFVFASLNMVIDILMCGSFFWRRRIHKQAIEVAEEQDEDIGIQNDQNISTPIGSGVSISRNENDTTQNEDNPLESESTIPAFNDLNMNSAFIHIFADTMRTLTSLTSGALVWLGGFDSIKTDAISSIIVSAFIILAAVVVAVESFLRLRNAYRH